ncbi:MAG: BatA domain-containing protein [Candidatus Acetothermia bacterium]|jgi:hypothetical protein|nr:BatA domain-containing protein [Candidatus Acetothermia bacterium]
MSFAFPMAWAWLASGLVVLLLHLFRRRERELSVSALFLWEQVPPDRASYLERLRWRFDLLLCLQLLGVILFAFALAQPLLQVSRTAGATAIVIDGSASMAADGRVEEAVAAARRAIAASSGPWTVVRWADPPELLVPSTSKREEALAGLSQFRPTLGGRPPLGQALALLPDPGVRIVVITDDPPPDPGVDVVALPPKDNLAILAFSVRPEPDGSGYPALVRVRNDTPHYQDVQLVLRAGDGTYLQSRLLAPKSEDTFVFPYVGALGPTFRVELLPGDAFPWDNVRYFTLAEAGSTVRVRWLGEEDRYLWAALQAAAPAVRVREPPWDLTVAVRVDLPASPNGPALLVGAGSPEAPLGGFVPAGAIHGGESPLLRHVVPGNFQAAAVRPPLLPDGAEVALWADDRPALARWEAAPGRRVLLTLDLPRSNLPLTVDFPILLSNALAWLLPHRPGQDLRVGEAMELVEGAEVLTPTGPVTGTWVPDRPGLYELRRDGRRERIAVNVPWEESLPGAAPSAPPVVPQRATAALPIWPWLGLATLFVLAGEWALAWRRGG